MEHQNCSELIRSIGDYIDSDLSPELCRELEEHIRGCENCRIVVDTTKKTISLYHDHQDEAGLSAEKKQKLLKVLDISTKG